MKKFNPPKFADKLFRWYCRNDLQDSIIGDLHEQFYHDLERKGIVKARLIYWITILKFFNRFTTKRTQNKTNQPMSMNYLKTPIRFLLKHRSYALINVVGLSIGLFSCLVISFFLHHELTFDQQHQNGHNIFRINMIFADNSGSETKYINSPPALAPGIQEMYPEIERATQLRYTGRTSLRNGDQVYFENHGFYADSSFLEVFTFPLVSGNTKTALDEPNSIVITSHLSKKYFGEKDPMGKLITMNNDVLLKVTGILEPIPSNSHIKFDFLISFETYTVPEGYLSDLTSWWWLGFVSYVQLQNPSGGQELQNKLDALYREADPDNETPFRTIVQPLEEIYLGSAGMTDDLASHMRSGNKYSIYALAVIALLILFIASFNLMNITVATSLTRGKEVGIKKVLGEEKSKLLVQLLLESVLITFISTVLAYVLFLLLFSQIKDHLNWDLEISSTLLLTSIPIALLFITILGVLAGLYPATLLTNLEASRALKQGLKTGKGAAWLTNGLISFQFIISVSLISSTIIVYQQIQYLRNQSLGFDSSYVVSMKLLPQDMRSFYDRFKEDLRQNSQIQSVSRSERIIGDPWPVNGILVRDEPDYKQVHGAQIGYDFLNTMGIELKTGRAFSEEFGTDSLGSIIINEACAKHLGFDSPVGEKVQFFGRHRTVIGVIEDFNFSSLHSEIAPVVMIMPFIDLENMYVKVAPGNLASSLDLIESRWNEVSNGAPLEMQLMDDHMNQLYQREEKLSLLITGFSLLAVLLACLGLYGLIALMVNKRIKEVGIRKVLGASVSSLLILFSKRYLGLIAIASLIAAPTVYYILSLWLNEFAYRIKFDFSALLLAALLLATISLLTIGTRALRTALANPIKALRDE
ncbi:MAG: ABC transporter permease [Cyclobacteriaceae bacterium]